METDMEQAKKFFLHNVLISLVMSVVVLVCATLLVAKEKSSDESAPFMTDQKESDTIFSFEKKKERSLLRLKGSGEKRDATTEDTSPMGIELFWGQLLFPHDGLLSTYYFLSGKLDSDSMQRFNATVGYFPPLTGGEFKLSYKVLRGELRSSIQGLDEYQGGLNSNFAEDTTEQGLGLLYKKHFDSFLREFGFKYIYSHLGGESTRLDPVIVDSPTVWREVEADVGFGDVDSHDTKLEAAIGSDSLDYPFLQAMRFDLGAGYQQIHYGAFQGSGSATDKGFSGIAQFKARTPLGVFKGWYEDSQSATGYYAGFQYGGLDLYFQSIDYDTGSDEQIIGFAITFDIFNPDEVFVNSRRPFFYNSDSGYVDVDQMQHLGGLVQNSFTIKPSIQVKTKDIYNVTKGSTSDVSIDGAGNPRLVVRTTCSLVGISSVSPASAANAFSISGKQVSISLTELPAGEQVIVDKIDDECCGYTQLTISTGSESGSIASVNVRDSVGCVPASTPAPTPTPTPAPVPIPPTPGPPPFIP